MYIFTNIKDKGAHWLGNYFKEVAKKRLPNKLKRIMFISSTLGLIGGLKTPDEEIVNHLNELFHLAKYPDSMKLPMYFKEAIWENMDPKHIMLDGQSVSVETLDIMKLNYQQRSSLADYFTINIPDWLKYADSSSIKNDILMLLSNFDFIILGQKSKNA